MTANAQPMVHVVDDDDSVRRSLVSLLEEVGVPVATFPSAEAFLQALRDDRRGCILLDVRMPGMSGLQLQQELRERGVTMPTIILTGHADVPMAVSAMSAGAAGFVEKPFHPQELLDRIHDCLEADARQAAFQAERRQAGDALARLSAREQEVLRQLVVGKPSKLIASALGISEKTVDVHRSNLMRKTGTRSVAELMRLWFLIHPVEESLDHETLSRRAAPPSRPQTPRTPR
jgi:FixJ family two-component response regulator